MRRSKISTLILLCTNYIPLGRTPPPNTTATPQPPFSDCRHCLNGGTYVGGYCHCLAGYSGVYCEMTIYSPPGTYGKGTGLHARGMYVYSEQCCRVCTYSPSPPLLYSFSSLPSLLPHPLSPLSFLNPLPLTLPPPHPPSCTHLPDRLGLSLWRMLQWHL